MTYQRRWRVCPQLLECWITLVTLPRRPRLDTAHGAVALFTMVILHDQVWVNKIFDDFMQYIISLFSICTFIVFDSWWYFVSDLFQLKCFIPVSMSANMCAALSYWAVWKLAGCPPATTKQQQHLEWLNSCKTSIVEPQSTLPAVSPRLLQLPCCVNMKLLDIEKLGTHQSIEELRKSWQPIGLKSSPRNGPFVSLFALQLIIWSEKRTQMDVVPSLKWLLFKMSFLTCRFSNLGANRGPNQTKIYIEYHSSLKLETTFQKINDDLQQEIHLHIIGNPLVVRFRSIMKDWLVSHSRAHCIDALLETHLSLPKTLLKMMFLF